MVAFDHLATLTTWDGMFEHAMHARPRREHGYCLDDVARGLVVTSREPNPSAVVRRLLRTYLRFTLAAQDDQGRFRNRRNDKGEWTDDFGVGDHWGRALWGLGTAAVWSCDDEVRNQALAGLTIGMRSRSPWSRSMAYAALGAFEVLRVRPGDVSALELLSDARILLGRRQPDPMWPWPERRLSYANAVIPEALMVVGRALDDDAVFDDGLALLTWLVSLQTSGGHLSVTPAGGWQPGEPRPGFDQQPIEVTALAEACARAYEFTGDPAWLDALDRCAAWFLGANDVGLPLYEPVTAGGYDGLHATRVNENLGAESTLAVLSTFQLHRLTSVATLR